MCEQFMWPKVGWGSVLHMKYNYMMILNKSESSSDSQVICHDQCRWHIFNLLLKFYGRLLDLYTLGFKYCTHFCLCKFNLRATYMSYYVTSSLLLLSWYNCLRFKHGREIRQINPSQTLMNLQYYNCICWKFGLFVKTFLIWPLT